MEARVPAARHGDQIARESLGLAARVPHFDAGDGLASAHAHDRPARQIARLCPLGSVLGARRAAFPGVDHRGDNDAGIGEVDRGANCIVMVGKDHRALARRHAIAIDVSAHRAGQHDAGTVVVAEHDSALDRACGQHRALGHDLPQALARFMRRRHRHMIVDPLDCGIGTAVIDALHGGAPQDAALWQAFKLSLRGFDPVERRRAVDVIALGKQPSAKPEILLG